MKHVPIRPPRDMTEERVFSRKWKYLMDTNGAINWVLRGFPYPIDQRAASVVASMVVWFGTNVGRSFLDTGAAIRSNVKQVRFPYLAAWGEFNARQVGNNSNACQIEFLIRTQDELARDVFPEASIQDIEAVNQLCMWLSTREGQAFLTSCEAEIERRKELDTVIFHSAAGRQNTPAVQNLIDKFVIRE